MTTVSTTTMTAAVHRAYGEPDIVEISDVPVPVPGPREVLIRVEAAALNPADLFKLRGRPWVLRMSGGLRRPRHGVIGTDAAGTVVAVGEAVTGVRRGDRVFGEARGSLAEYAVASSERVTRLPDAVAAEDGAAVVMAGLAALHGLRAAGLAPGQRVLINGAAGGIGHLAVQLATATGAEVTAVCSAANADWVADLGAARVVDYTRESILDLDERFDLVFDNVGNHRMREVMRLLTPGGVLLPNSGEPGPDGGPLARVAKAAWVNLVVRGVRVQTYYSSPRREDLERLAAMLADGTLRPHVDRVWALREAEAALARVASRHAAGKVVVAP
ncbi:MAG: NAD(P)-dependent alcohol dehydrogenase [Actinomycetes bacterium]